MNPTPRTPGRPTPHELPVEAILEEIRGRFYTPEKDRRAAGRRWFFRDRRMLIYAVSWPALWLHQRALTCSPQRYHALIVERLEAISLHGDRSRFDPGAQGGYFPAYLLKCLQDWFSHHGDQLYDQLKHTRNAIDKILASPIFAAAVRKDAQHINVLLAAHQLVRPKRKKTPACDPAQLSLF